ncbi:hypothetical protein SAMN05877753_101356 [Bacillus oleivorans]|uniref:Uncharacterized protein n=1 Tax=Bacillus oleivorans TaxID=1448271 RepID=A0A285CHG6_9BACI|nr:CBO0543 family protein [Bacillus oleivorans]SNX67042.1 hypothetical protein SAMN05877753_101356 [Bacillus oleivorans]
MDKAILWTLLLIGVVLLFFGVRKPFIKDTLLVFLLSAYFSTFIGVFVVEEKMLRYPVRFLSEYFEVSILYEYVLFPVVCMYFFQTTRHSRYIGIALQCALYTTALTIVEVLLERYTDLIEYNTWNWIYTFISNFLLMIVVRILVHLINKRERWLENDRREV